jgi:hypothetical protein
MGIPTTKLQGVLPAGQRGQWAADAWIRCGLALPDPACAHMAWEVPRLIDISAVAAAKRNAIAHFRTQTGEVPVEQPAGAARTCTDPILPELRGIPGMSAQPY